jgi:hypothetical protein
VAEARAFAAEVRRGEASAGRDPGTVRLTARLNACIAADGNRSRDIVRPGVARLLGRGSLKLATAEAEGLTLPPEATAPMANAPYAEGVKPYLPLLPLVPIATSTRLPSRAPRLVANTSGAAPRRIVRSSPPLAGDGVPVEDTTPRLGNLASIVAAEV